MNKKELVEITERKRRIQRFESIMEEIAGLNDEALEIVREVFNKNSREYQAAKSYWYAHIEGNSIGEKYNGSMETMQDTLKLLGKGE